MSTTPRLLLAVLTVMLVTLAQAHADEGALGREDLDSVREATRDLASEVEYLQDLIVELRSEKERSLYGQADAVLAGIETFQKTLQPEVTRERLEQEFEALDGKVHQFVEAVQDLGPEHRVLQRAALRVEAADDQMHFALFAPGDAGGKANQILERQARVLLIAARQLDKTAEYTLGAVPGRSVLVADLHKLAQAAEQFETNLATEPDRPKLRKDFAVLNQAWERATQGIGDLKIGENSHLLRSAVQLDRAHARLYRLLGPEGERPQLIIRT